jgi:hypothetical protein
MVFAAHATEDCGGIVNVTAAALLAVVSFSASAITNVYVVPVCAFVGSA